MTSTRCPEEHPETGRRCALYAGHPLYCATQVGGRWLEWRFPAATTEKPSTMRSEEAVRAALAEIERRRDSAQRQYAVQAWMAREDALRWVLGEEYDWSAMPDTGR